MMASQEAENHILDTGLVLYLSLISLNQEYWTKSLFKLNWCLKIHSQTIEHAVSHLISDGSRTIVASTAGKFQSDRVI